MKLYDANNWVRVVFETDPSGMALRNLFHDAYLDTAPQIWIFDGKNSRAKRREIYPEYKANRQGAPDNFYVTLNIFKELLGHTNKIMVEVPGYEADDVIATMVRSNPTQKFEIQSTDRDFYALHNEYVSQNRQGIEHIDPIDTRLYKTLVNDKSDNVKGIDKFGDKAWEKLTPDMKALWLEALEDKVVFTSFPKECYGLTEKQYVWSVANWKLLKAYWIVVDFLPVPSDLIALGTKIGTPNYPLAQQLLRELFLVDPVIPGKPTMSGMGVRIPT